MPLFVCKLNVCNCMVVLQISRSRVAVFIFAFYRVFVALYANAWLLVSIVVDGVEGGLFGVQWFIFLTHWGYTILCFYFLLAAVVTLLCQKEADNDAYSQASMPLPWYIRAQWFLFNVAMTGALKLSPLVIGP